LLIIPQEGYEGIVMAEEDDNIDINARETADNDNDSDEDDDHTHDHATEQEIKDHEEIAAAGAGEDKEEPLVDGDAERGRAADSATLATSQAAGRHASISPSKWTPMQPPTKSKPAPAQESTTQSPPSTRAQLDMSDEPVIPTTVQGRGTLSRGKGSRGSAANVWAQAAAASATEAPTTVPEATDAEDVPPSVLGMARKESAESVVLVPTTVDDAENTESAPAATSTSTPPRTPSPDRTILKLETQLLPVNETTEAQTPDALATPVPTDPATTVPSITQDTEDDVETTTTLDVEPSIPSPSSSPKPPTTTTTESDASALASSPAKSTLNVARSEVLISPKSELLPLASPKNELLSVSPKSPGKRRGGGNRPKPKSPNSKSKSPSPSPSPRKLDASEDE
jgi:hypothetical protein